eukprot:CAMPEP_0196142088 /NCGR_PEP_ID=MMETSP0910-20130528/10976_1 /TAXON_ID=49265 /ORGANISM="Thalassiosira rotula, Strain GSO102" /LENGTH=205 /DNA_ID=CAMNT_0041403345 /DNA_START=288 /DNA_END=906 /DNA_ORIENTATION=-
MTEKAVSEMEYFRLAILRKALLMALVKDFTTRLARFGVIFLIKAVSETGADIFNFLASSFNAFNHILSFLIANTTSPAVEGSGRLRVAFIRLDRLAAHFATVSQDISSSASTTHASNRPAAVGSCWFRQVSASCSASAQGEGSSWTPAKENERFVDRRVPTPFMFMAVEVNMADATRRVMQAIFILVSLAGGMAMFVMSDVDFYE